MKHLHQRLLPLTASLALLCGSVIPLSADSVTFSGNGMTYFLQNDALNEGWSIHEGIFTVNGTAAYCIEPQETVVIGQDLYQTGSWETYSAYSSELKNRILEYSYFGYGYGGFTDMEYWYATQILIWQAINPAFSATRVHRDPVYAGDGFRSPQAVDITDSINDKKNQIEETVRLYHGGLSPKITGSNGNAISEDTPVYAGETITLSDDHLSHWQLSEKPDGFSLKGNTLTVSAKKAGTYRCSFRFKGTDQTIESAPLVLRARDGSRIQTLIIRGHAETKTYDFSFTFKDCGMKIAKKLHNPNHAVYTSASLEGARYELFNETENTSAGFFVTGASGVSGILTGLNKADIYTLREVSAPKGCVLDETLRRFRLDELEGKDGLYSLDTQDEIIHGRIAVHKVITSRTSSGPMQDEEGAGFTILPDLFIEKYGSFEEALKHISELKEEEYDVITTDKSGRAESRDLIYGTYTVTQTAAASDDLEYCKPFHVSVDGSSFISTFELSNIQNEYELKIIKTDALTGKKAAMHSASFQLFDETGKPVTMKIGASVYDTFMTRSRESHASLPANVYLEKAGEEGTVTLPSPLSPGSYTVKEVSAPSGYQLNKKPLTAEISAASLASEAGQLITVTMADQRRYGSVSLQKTIAETQGDASLIDRKDLSGFVFALIAREDILAPDTGEVMIKAGTEFKRLTTESDGTLIFNDIPLGSWVLKEVSAKAGVLINEEEITFEINDEKTEHSFTVEDQPVRTVFSKKQASGSEELPGAKLSVRKADGTLIDEWISGAQPHVIEGLNAEETYIMREEITPRDSEGNDEGYVQAEEIRFTPSQGTLVTMKDQRVRVVKTDENGKPLPGASMQVIDQEGTVVDSWITEETPHYVRGLKQSETYLLRETEAPAGYYRADDITFEVKPQDGDLTLTMTDTLIRLRIRKIDEKSGKDLAGVVLTLFEIGAEEETKIASWVTDGSVIEADGLLKAGTSYRLEETAGTQGVYTAADLFFQTDAFDPGDPQPLMIMMVDSPVETAAAKTDPAGNYLAGAHLCLRDSDGNVLYEWTSSKDGPEDLSPYVKGGERYIIEEISAPEGCALMDPLSFTVSGTAERHQLIHAVDRPIRVRLQIIKTDAADGKPLKDAHFQIFCADGSKAASLSGENAEVITGEDGRAEVTLPYDPEGYYVLETKAPSGYRLNRSRFEISPQPEVSAPLISVKVEVSDEKKTVETGLYGSRGRLMILLAGVLACAALLLHRRH